jgi:hypothetical protein
VGDQSAVGQYVWFDAVDSGLGGGTGDQFLLESYGGFHDPGCLPPTNGFPITQGNIIIKATGPLP